MINYIEDSTRNTIAHKLEPQNKQTLYICFCNFCTFLHEKHQFLRQNFLISTQFFKSARHRIFWKLSNHLREIETLYWTVFICILFKNFRELHLEEPKDSSGISLFTLQNHRDVILGPDTGSIKRNPPRGSNTPQTCFGSGSNVYWWVWFWLFSLGPIFWQNFFKLEVQCLCRWVVKSQTRSLEVPGRTLIQPTKRTKFRLLVIFPIFCLEFDFLTASFSSISDKRLIPSLVAAEKH